LCKFRRVGTRLLKITYSYSSRTHADYLFSTGDYRNYLIYLLIFIFLFNRLNGLQLESFPCYSKNFILYRGLKDVLIRTICTSSLLSVPPEWARTILYNHQHHVEYIIELGVIYCHVIHNIPPPIVISHFCLKELWYRYNDTSRFKINVFRLGSVLLGEVVVGNEWLYGQVIWCVCYE